MDDDSRPVSGGKNNHSDSCASLVTSQHSISRPVSHSAERRQLESAGGSRPTTALSSVPPDYLRPIVKSAVRRWKRLHETNMIEKLVQTKEERRAAEKESRELAHKTARRIPLDLLAREWLNKERATIETRSYLIDNILPYVIMGLEQLLLNVMKRGLAEKALADPNFNPINFLAQYLMRNNPRYSNFSEASPYIRGIRMVSEELRQEIFQFKDNKLARLKATARQKREEMEMMEHQEKLEMTKRKVDVQELFEQFLVGDNVRVDLAMIQSAVKSFTEIAERLPEDLKKHLTLVFEVQVTEDTSKKLSRKEFSDYLNPFIEEMPVEVFEKFRDHLQNCIVAYKAALEKENRKNTLLNLFVSCDHDQIGLLDRHRILELFEKFYGQASLEVQKMIRDPAKWPVREVEEELRNIPEEPIPQFESDEEEEEEEVLQTAGIKDDKSGEGTETEVQPVEEMEATPRKEQEKEEESAESNPPGASNSNLDSQKESEKKGEKEEGAEEMKEEEKAKSDEKMEDDVKEEIKETEEVKEEMKEAEEVKEEIKEAEEVKEEIKEAEEVKEEEATVEGNVKAEEETKEEDEVKLEEGIIVEDEVKLEEEMEVLEQAKVEKEAELEVEDKAEVQEERPSSAEKGAADEAEKETKDKEKSEEMNDIEGAASQGENKGKQELLDEMGKAKQIMSGVERLTLETAGSARPVTSVTFAEGTEFEREKTGMSSLETARSQSSAFDEQNVDASQFVQLSETFLGDACEKTVLDSLVQFVRDGYQETEEERMARLMKAHRIAMSAKRKKMIDILFEKWDNDGSGYLEMEELEAVLFKYKDGAYKKAAAAAKRDLRHKSRSHDNRLTKREFRHFLYGVCHHFGDEDGVEFLIEYLIQSIERSYAERVRGEARKKWLHQISMAAETGGASMEPVYRAVFQALYKDAEAHGDGKRISANIAMLEANDVQPDRGPILLRYVAATPDDSPYILGRVLFKDTLQINAVSFQAVESGKPIHVPRVSASPNVVYFNTNRKEEEKDGSFIAVPLKDQRKRVFGTLGIDTLNDPQSKSIFITHEIQFFQGVAKAFSFAYHYVDVQRKTLRVAESALSWICRRSPSVHNVTYYMKEPDGKGENYVLRRMLFTDERGDTTISTNPPRLERRDNLFRDYLFKTIDTSESVSSDAYGERHLAIPLRDLEGVAVAVVDIGIGPLKELPPAENKEVMKMLKLLQVAYSEIAKAADGEAEDGELTPSNAEMMFDKLMLVDLRQNVAHLDAQAYAELRSYKEPPKAVLNILQAVLSIFYPEKAMVNEFAKWDHCKKYVKVSLSKKIMNYEPQADAENAPLELIMSYLNEVPHNMVERHGSKPARYLYNWVFVCVSLIEHTRKMRQNKKQDGLPPVPEEAEEAAS